MRRVLVIGCGGAGKSTLARQLVAVTDLPLIALDRVYWRSGWVEPPKDEWRRIVQELAAGPAWVMDGNYSATFDLRMPRADTVVWLDYARLPACVGAVLRTLKSYGGPRPDLPDGCREKLEVNFLRHIWNFPTNSRPRIVDGLKRFGAHLRVVRCAHDRDAAAFLHDAA